MGDERTYNYSIVIRAVTSVDGMTADFYMFNKNDLTEISNKIISNVKEVNRVLYDFTSKPFIQMEQLSGSRLFIYNKYLRSFN